MGLVAGACLAEIGHDVICVDNDRQKISALQAGETIIHEEFLPELLTKHRDKRLIFTTDMAQAVGSSDVVFIAVGTPPSDTGEADLSWLEAVCHDIARQIHSFKVVVVKSTVPVGSCRWIRKILVRYGAAAGSFEVGSNPEFLREGTGGYRFSLSRPHHRRQLMTIAAPPFFASSTSRSRTAVTRAGRAPSRFPTTPSCRQI